LLLNVLVYRVPVEAEISEEWVDKARAHCRMTPERLALLRGEAHARHWRNMAEKRARRLAWKQEHGTPPPYGWTPPAPGEPDHKAAVTAMRLYYRKIKPFMAKLKRCPQAQADKLANRYLAARKIRSRARRLAALRDAEARLVLQWYLERGRRISVRQFLALQSEMLPDNALPRRFRKNKAGKTGLSTDASSKKEAENLA